MAKKKGDRKNKLLFLVVPILLSFGYQMLNPYLEETSKMREETKKLQQQIQQVKTDALMYSQDWEVKHSQKERELLQVLPEKVVPSEILRYFATSFEKDHKGVEFLSLIPSSPVLSSIVADKDDSKVKARISKVQIKAKVPPEYLLEYIDYVEKYPGFSRISEVNITSQGDGKTTNIDLDMNVELYLLPIEWVPKEKKKPEDQKLERSTASYESTSGTKWFELRQIDEEEKKIQEHIKEESDVPPVRKIARPPTPPKFTVSQFIGSSIVIGEQIFEEGDSVEGWNILKVDPISKVVVIQKGRSLYKVVVK